MKKLFTLFCFFVFPGLSIAQQASDYFPSQMGFEWNFKVTPLDSANNPVNSLSVFRIDSFATVANYEGHNADIVETKLGPLQSILQQPFTDSLLYYFDGTNGFEYLNLRNIEGFLATVDEEVTISNFSFVDFLHSLQNWYSTYRFASNENTTYTILQKDTTVTYSIFNIPFQLTLLGTRLQDQTIQTVDGNFDCKKFLLQWNLSSSFLGDLITINDTTWIATGNWIVQEIMPGQYVDIESFSILGIDPFSIPGLETKLTDEIVTSVDEKEIPHDIFLAQNYPNPFNPRTRISWQLAVGSQVTLKVYNILGKEVATLVDGYKPAGYYKINFNAENLSSGTYFYKLQAGNFIEVKKMILMK